MSKSRAWTVLRVTSADFWQVGDLNARFCMPYVASRPNAGVHFTTEPSCDAGAAAQDCTQDPPLKGFGL